MTSKTTEITPNPKQPSQINSDACNNFTEKVLRYGAIACTPFRGSNFDKNQAVIESRDSLKALMTEGALQEMLATQMISIHLLQQMTIALANDSGITENKQYYTNSAVKLANCFTHQAALLAKLQGIAGQKIVVEHVEVHHGGQAVVGNINGVTPITKDKK